MTSKKEWTIHNHYVGNALSVTFGKFDLADAKKILPHMHNYYNYATRNERFDKNEKLVGDYLAYNRSKEKFYRYTSYSEYLIIHLGYTKDKETKQND